MLSTARLVKRLRNSRHVIATNFNRAFRGEFIPRQSGSISIETSSICNLNCVFCAYPKKKSPKIVMSNDLFRDYVDQALEMGYHHFDLTPCTGDIFMDRNIFKKFEFLECVPRVKGYAFFTNFTIPKRTDIERLFALRKLSDIAISVYGRAIAECW